MSDALRFVVQEHYARSHHFDLRLEKDGLFKSWAVPKGIPSEAGVRRLALEVEDHDLAFGSFEGEIPNGKYGAGSVKIWDRGEYAPVEWTDDEIVFKAYGTKMSGQFALVRFPKGGARHWLLMKSREKRR